MWGWAAVAGRRRRQGLIASNTLVIVGGTARRRERGAIPGATGGLPSEESVRRVSVMTCTPAVFPRSIRLIHTAVLQAEDSGMHVSTRRENRLRTALFLS